MRLLRVPRAVSPFPALRTTGILPALAAHAVAFTLVAHCHYFIRPPSRQLWLLLELAISGIIWKLGRTHFAKFFQLLRDRNLTVIVTVSGIFLAAWWAFKFSDTCWIHAAGVQPVLRVLLFGSHAGVAMLAVGAILLVTSQFDPSCPLAEKAPSSVTWWPVVALLVLTTLTFSSWYVAQEQTIYLADGMFYWTTTADWGQQLFQTPRQACEDFASTTQRGGYTLLPSLVPGIVMGLVGDTRTAFIATNAVVYLAAAFFMLLWISARLTRPNTGGMLVGSLFLLTSPLAWVPVLQGYPDVGGVILAMLAMWLVVRQPVQEMRATQLLVVATVLVTMLLFRRWYSFWAVGLLTVVGVECCLTSIRDVFARRGSAALGAFRPCLVLGVFCFLVLAALAWPALPEMIGNQYASKLRAYRGVDSFLMRLKISGDFIGFGYLGLSVLASGYLLTVRESRRAVLYLLGVTSILTPLFYRMQDPNSHHLYLFLPAILLPPVLAAMKLLHGRPLWQSCCVAAIVLTCGIVNIGGTISDVFKPTRDRFLPLTPQATHFPVQRGDRPEFERMMTFLNQHSEKKYVVLSSSLTFHSSMLQSVSRSYRLPFPAAKQQLTTLEVDRVLGFPHTLFQAQLVVVADPVQLHLRPEEQQTISIPQRLLMSGEGIGRAFRKRPEKFTLDGGVTVWVYERTTPIAREDFDAFCELLRQAHPDLPSVSTPSVPAEELLKLP